MEILKFKTNVTDREALAKVAPYIDKLEAIKNWQLDTESEENILSIAGEDVDPQLVKNVFNEAGYEAHLLRVVGISGQDT